jgi:hypothetical protein
MQSPRCGDDGNTVQRVTTGSEVWADPAELKVSFTGRSVVIRVMRGARPAHFAESLFFRALCIERNLHRLATGAFLRVLVERNVPAAAQQRE